LEFSWAQDLRKSAGTLAVEHLAIGKAEKLAKKYSGQMIWGKGFADICGPGQAGVV
jgi:hypothetical protein